MGIEIDIGGTVCDSWSINRIIIYIFLYLYIYIGYSSAAVVFTHLLRRMLIHMRMRTYAISYTQFMHYCRQDWSTYIAAYTGLPCVSNYNTFKSLKSCKEMRYLCFSSSKTARCTKVLTQPNLKCINCSLSLYIYVLLAWTQEGT